MSICPQNESLAVKNTIASMKRGSRRSAARNTPINTPHWQDGLIIAFPMQSPVLPVAASN